jgi:ATP-dependent Clp protease ATP-binding subunit ClpC
VFERFTGSARQVIVSSQREAAAQRADHVYPHHMLLGVFEAENATAAAVLASLGVEPSAVRAHAAAMHGPADNENNEAPGHIPFSDAAKRGLEGALRESRALDHTYIGSEHLVLGLMRPPSGDTAALLGSLGVESEAVCDAILVRLGSVDGSTPAEP